MMLGNHMRPLVYALLIFLLAGGVMVGGLSGIPLLDDIPEIQGNPHIRELFPPWSALTGGYYLPTRPLPYLSFAVDYQIWGASFTGYHVTNILLHAATAALLFGVAWNLLNLRPPPGANDGTRDFLAFAIAALWAIHPLQTHAVTYVYQRMEVMMAFFALLAIFLFLRAVRSSRPGAWLAASTGAVAAAVASKEAAMVLPLVIAACDRTFVEPSLRKIFRHRGAYYAALAVIPGTLLFVILAGQVNSYDARSIRPSALEYFLTQPGVLLHYLRLTILPAGLCFDYAWPVARTWQSILPPLLIISAAGIASIWLFIRRSPLGWLGVSFFLLLAPTSSFRPVADIANEYRMYLPSAAIIALAVLLFWRLCHASFQRFPANTRLLGRCSLAIFIGAAIALAMATHRRNTLYQSSHALWEDVTRKAPHNSRAWAELALCVLRDGNFTLCAEYSQRALALDPKNAIAVTNLGAALIGLGRLEEARSCLETGAQLPQAPSELFVMLGQLAPDAYQADAYFRRALVRDSHNFVALNNVANALARTGNYREAIPLYERALLTAPNSSIPSAQIEQIRRNLDRARSLLGN
jgi:tetratricopeptide (TPR) repeat protein